MKNYSLLMKCKSVFLTLVSLLCISINGLGQHTVTFDAYNPNPLPFSSVIQVGSLYVSSFDFVENALVVIKVDDVAVDNTWTYVNSKYEGWTSGLCGNWYAGYWNSFSPKDKVFISIDVENKKISFLEKSPLPASITNKPSITATTTVCPGNMPVLSLDFTDCTYNVVDAGYPKYQWFRGTTQIESANGSTYTSDAFVAGEYTCKFCVSSTLCVTTDPITITDPGTPKVTLSKSTLNFNTYVGDGSIATQSVTATVANVCDGVTATASFVDGNENFSIDDNGDGTFTITPLYDPDVVTTSSYTAHVKFVVDGGENAILTISGNVYEPLTATIGDCVPIGGTAGSYSVTTTGGASPLKYQWYDKDGNKIEGATSSTYSGTETTITCVVTDAVGTSVSSTYKGLSVETSWGMTIDENLKMYGEHAVFSTTIPNNNTAGFFLYLGNDKTTTYSTVNNGDIPYTNISVENNYYKINCPYNSTGSNCTYYVVIDNKANTISYQLDKPDYTPAVKSASLKSSQQAFCNTDDVITLTAEATVENPASCYPQYVFKRNGIVVQSGSSNTLDVAIAAAGSYTCEIYADANTMVATESVTLNTPNPYISVSKQQLTFESQVSESIGTQSFTAEVKNSCSDDLNFTVSGDYGISKVKGEDGVYTITVTPTYSIREETTDPNRGTITISADGATNQSVDLKGYVYPCSGGELAFYDFSTQGLGADNGITVSSTMTEATDSYAKGYKIQSSSYFSNTQGIKGNSGEAIQFNLSEGDNSILEISGLDPNLKYAISATAGVTSFYGDRTFTFSINGVVPSTGTLNVDQNTSSTYSPSATIATSEALTGVSSTNIAVNVSGNGNGPYAVYIDNLSISKLCPPTVTIDLTSGSACDGTGVFTATPSGTAPFEYEWIVNGVVKQVRSSSATFAATDALSSDDIVTCKVYDAYELSDVSDEYVVHCLTVTPTFSVSPICLSGETYLRISDADKASIASAGMAQPVTYQWYLNGTAKDASSQSYQDLHFIQVLSSDEGTYTLGITDANGVKYTSNSVALTITTPKFTIQNDVTDVTLDAAMSYSSAVTVVPDECYKTATVVLEGTDAGYFTAVGENDVYTVILNSANQSIAGIYNATMVLYDRDRAKTEKDVTVSATVPLTLNELTSTRPCDATVGFTTTIPATKTDATAIWKIDGSVKSTQVVNASTTETTIAFLPPSNLTVGAVVSLEVTTEDGLTATKDFTISSCGPTITITPTNFSEAGSYNVCPGQTFPAQFNITFANVADANSVPYTYKIIDASNNVLFESSSLTDGGGSKEQNITFSSTAGSYKYTIQTDFEYEGEHYTDYTTFTVVVDNTPLKIDDVAGCSSEYITFVDENNTGNIYWGTSNGNYNTLETGDGLIDINKTFYQGATSTGTPYYFSFLSELGTEKLTTKVYCKNVNATAKLYSNTYLSKPYSFSFSANVCQYSNVLPFAYTPQIMVSTCARSLPTDVSYQWYVNTKKSIENAKPIIGATSSALDQAKIDLSTAGTFYYFCKVTSSTNTVYSDYNELTIYPVPSAPIIADTSMVNQSYFIVPINNVEISADETNWRAYNKSDEIGYLYSNNTEPREYTYYARTGEVSPSGETCYSPESEFHVWVGYAVGCIVSGSDFEDQEKCVGTPADTWFVQGGSQWGTNNLTYRWYRSETEGKTTGGTLVSTEQSYTPPTDNIGTFYYYCVIGYQGQTATKAIGTKKLVVNGTTDFTIDDVSVCSDGSDVEFTYATDTYAVSYGLDADNLSSTRAAGTSSSMNVGTSGSEPFTKGTTTPVYFSYTDDNGCVISTSANVVVYSDGVTITDESEMEDFAVCQTAEIPTLSITAVGCGGSTPTYRWYRVAEEDKINSISETYLISGAVGNTYTPSATTDVGTYWYYCQANYRGSGEKVFSKAVKGTIYKTPETGLTPNVALNADDELEIYCTGSIDFTATKGFTSYIWMLDVLDGDGNIVASSATSTAVNGMTYSPDCSDETQPSQFRLRVTDVNGCPGETTIKLNIHPLGTTYYYCGPAGSEFDAATDDKNNWGVNDLNNWYVGDDCTGAHPADFTTAGTKYIIRTAGVELLEGQTWDVGGKGTKVEVGTGKWNSMSQAVAGANACYQSHDYKAYCEYYSSIGSNEVEEKFGIIGSTDFRSDAVGLKISGEMNCLNGSEIDVLAGGALEIATDEGNPTIGTCAEDEHINYDPEAAYSYNVLVVPGSSVTYSGTGVSKIQAATYSQLYINQTDATQVVFPSGEVEIKQALKFDKTIDVDKITMPDDNTVSYTGSLNQEIAPITYSNLQLDNASEKEMIGDVTVTNQMYVGPSATLVGGDGAYVLSLTNSGEPLDFNGKSEPGNSTVEYTSADEVTIAAMNYYNLALKDVTLTKETVAGETSITKVTSESLGGNRIFPAYDSEGIIGIAGALYTADASKTMTVTGSLVEFNGTERQEIPAFTFDKLQINNTSVENNTTSSMDNRNVVSIAGDVTVQGQLILKEGILYTADYVNADETPKYTLNVTNSSPSAITTGVFNSTQDASFIVGPVTRSVSSCSNTTEYEFPVGNFTYWYQPLTMSSIEKTSSVTVSAESGTAGSNFNTPLEAVDHTKYWSVKGNYSTASFSIESKDDLGEYNCIAIAPTLSGTYSTLNGTTNGKAIEKSNVGGATDAYVTFGKQVITYKTYYYDCSKTPAADITDISSWWTETDGNGKNATSFTEDYATWIILCNATVSTKPLEITGSNVAVELGENAKLTLYNTFKASSLTQGKSSQLYVGKKTECTIYGTHELADKAVINNYGVLNTYSKTFALNNGASVYNYSGAQWNMYNVALKLSSTDSSTNNNCGHILNYGDVNMTNSSLYVEGRYTQLKNAEGAQWIIDNSMSANNKSVVFDNTEFRDTENDYQFVSMECGSVFYVKHSDVTMWYGGMQDVSAYINGDLIVEDGNMLIRRKSQGGGKFNIEGEGCGSIYLLDTDKSGDGLLTIQGSGGSEFNVYGTVYAMGVVTEDGSGDKINVKDGGFMFIGNMGATLPQYSWVFTINVEAGGTLNYCGNRTALGDNVGSNAGTLNYAESFYGAGLDNPVHQGDFTSTGKIYALYEDNDACMADYNARTKTEIEELLPVEFTMLYGICNDEVVELHWQTASETNNEYFTILRSFDGIAFEEIDYVWGAGTTTMTHDYVFYDTDDKEGLVYYKLRQTDYDGNITETKVIAVHTCEKNSQFWVKKDEVVVLFGNPTRTNHVVMTTLTGKILYSKSFKDVESARIALPQSNGVYIISVIDKQQITSEKIVKY